MSDDVYAAERARLAAQRAEEQKRQRQAERDAAAKARLEEIAAAEVHQIAVRAWRELSAAGIGPVGFVRFKYSQWSGKTTFPDVSVPGRYWGISPNRASLLVNEHGMFGHNVSFVEGGSPVRPKVLYDGPDTLRPIRVGDVFNRIPADWDNPERLFWITADPDGRAMLEPFLRLDVAVTEDVIRRIEAARSH